MRARRLDESPRSSGLSVTAMDGMGRSSQNASGPWGRVRNPPAVLARAPATGPATVPLL